MAASPAGAAPPVARTEMTATRRIVLFSMALAALSALLLLVVARQTPAVTDARVAWPLLALGYALTDSFAVHVEVRDNAHSFTMNELPLMIGLFLCRPEQLVLARVVGMVVALVLVRRQRPLKALFNLALSFL